MVLKKWLGEILISMGLVTRQQLDKALQKQESKIEEKTSSEKVPSVSLISDARFTADTGRSPLLGQILIDIPSLSVGSITY